MDVQTSPAVAPRAATSNAGAASVPFHRRPGSTPPAVVTMSEAERVRIVRETIGPVDDKLRPFLQGIRQVVFQRHDRYVRPLIEAHWPESLNERAGVKLRFLTCNLYASSPYAVLFSAPNPPWPVAVSRLVGGRLALSPALLSSLAGLTARAVGSILKGNTERRILQTGAFIATIDHVYDHCFEGVDPVERGRRMHGLLDGTWVPDDSVPYAGAFRLVRALYLAFSDGIEPDEQPHHERAMASLRDYIDAEVKAMTGVDDPSGRCWRMAGVLGTIDGLISPVAKHTGEIARTWMYDVSLFVQILDDFLDAGEDWDDIRPTPMLTGEWDESTLREMWQSTVDGTLELARKSGIQDENWLALVRETYRLMALETAEAMGAGPAG